jgi:hypothetical protein
VIFPLFSEREKQLSVVDRYTLSTTDTLSEGNFVDFELEF